VCRKKPLEAAIDQFASGIPLGRVGDPAELASVVVFLASSDSSFVNDVELTIDGGQTQHLH
jgi:NAD(P)-dependent dehydrogenase (short-subunit alcohol dehydrogenase family)